MKELNHVQKQLVKWSKVWLAEKEQKKKAFYLRNTLILGKIVSKEIKEKQR